METATGNTAIAAPAFPAAAPAIARWRLWAAAAVTLVATGLFAWAALTLGDSFSKRWERLESGFDRTAVRELLGEPDAAYPELEIDAPFLRLWHERFGIGNERWVYERVPRGHRLRFYYTVLFDDGKVVDKSIRYALADPEDK